MKQYDLKKNGFLAYDAFVQIVSEKIQQRDPEEELRAAFSLFLDEDGSKINVKRLEAVTKQLGENLSSDELRGMIREFDRDGDEEISFEEFKRIMK